MAARIKNMTEGKPASLIFSFALPLMIGNVFQQLYTVVDTMVVGKALGVGALAALGAADWLNWMMLGIIQGFTQGFGILMAATIGVPLYACGGGTIPLLQAWLIDGMSMGSAAAFMITGPATKITNLGAVKIVLGAKRFALYLAFTILFALVTGWVVNMIL